MTLLKRLVCAILIPAILVCMAGCSGAVTPGKNETAPHDHTYKNECAVNCVICGEPREGVSHTPGETTFNECLHTTTCSKCGECIDAESGIHSFNDDGVCAVCGYKAEPLTFPSGILAGPKTVIETKHLIFKIAEGIFYPGNLEELADNLTDALEEVSGLGFLDKNHKKIVVDVQYNTYPSLYPSTSPESETGQAYASHGEVVISAGDLFLGNSNALAHELSHALMFCYTNLTKDVSKVFCEGFAEYNCHAALLKLEATDPTTAYYLDESSHNIFNNYLTAEDVAKISQQPLSYWMENPQNLETSSGNAGYDLGMQLMYYFDETYGNHGEWVKCVNKCPNDIAAADKAYGEGSTDGFYQWLTENRTKLYGGISDYFDIRANLQELSLNLYPWYMAFANPTQLSNGNSFRYKDVFFSLEDTRMYIRDYKGHSVDGLTLTANGADVAFFDSEGKVMDYVHSPRNHTLNGVSCIKLDGEGTCELFQIDGYDQYQMD